MKYVPYITENAENNLRSICEYIVSVLRSPKAKTDLVKAIDEKLIKICNMPTSYRVCEYPPLAHREIRYAVVKKSKLYFSIEEQTKTVHILYIRHELQCEKNLYPND